jgi:hypothetical protein
MASGFEARVALSKEVTYGTRVAPARFFPLTAEDFGFTYNRYFSPAIGTGMWGRPSVITTKVGAGSISGDVTTTGFGFLLDGLHGNAVSPVQQGATAAYLQTHTLSTSPSKSFSVQVQTPPVTSATLVPHDMTGVMFGGATFSWNAAGVLSYEFPTVYQNLDIAQSNVAYVAPAAYDLYGFQLGTLTIAGVAETNVIGDGSITFEYPLRDDAFALGTGGTIAKPVITDKPRAAGSFTADFNDNANLTRVINNTVADVVLKFEGATAIASTYKPYIEITLPDCVFTSPRPTVGDPGPVSQPVEFEAASSTADSPVIKYQSSDTTL